MAEANVCAYLDGGVDGVADDAGIGLPGAEPDRGDLGAGVEHEVPRHRRLSQSLCYWALCHTRIGKCRGEQHGKGSYGGGGAGNGAYIGAAAGGCGGRGRLGGSRVRGPSLRLGCWYACTKCLAGASGSPARATLPLTIMGSDL
jgi:hypothetical protein